MTGWVGGGRIGNGHRAIHREPECAAGAVVLDEDVAVDDEITLPDIHVEVFAVGTAVDAPSPYWSPPSSTAPSTARVFWPLVSRMVSRPSPVV